MSFLNWSTSLKTPPTSEPLTVADAKLHLRETDSDEDDLIAALITAAREYVENATSRALITQTWYWKASGFPCGPYASIVLPRPPLVSITSVSYVDTNGVTQTWPSGSTGYQLVKPSGPRAQYASIAPAYQQVYPITRCQPEAVTIEYVCGYGDATAVPESIKQAMRLLVAHWYENREAVDMAATAAGPVPLAVEALLGGFVVERF